MQKRSISAYVAALALAGALTTAPVANAMSDDRSADTDTAESTLAAPSRARLSTMDLPRLQIEAAKLQAEFVRASLALERARLDLRLSRAAVVEALKAYEAAQRIADGERAQLAAYLDLLYSEGPNMDPDLMLMLTAPHSKDAMWKQNMVFQQVTTDQTVTADGAIEAQLVADTLHSAAETAKMQADLAEDRVQEVLADISRRADEVTAKAEASFTDNEQAALFNDAQAAARNDATAEAWAAYRARLKAEHLTPPDARALRKPRHLPRGLTPLRDRQGTPIPGVAVSPAETTVLPRQVVDAVTASLGHVGKPYVAGNTGPETFDCAGLIDAAYPAFDLPDTPARLFEQTFEVPNNSVQVGDLVFFANSGAGIHHVGLYLGGNLMIAADGESSQVGVLSLPDRPYAVTRPSLGSPKSDKHAPTGDGSMKMSCGVQLVAGGATQASMFTPIAAGHFSWSAKFGQPGPLWASGVHTGLDLAAPVGTQVLAARDGVVSISHPEWAGNLVTIDHGDGLATRYAHLSAIFVKQGETVQGGQTIGAVGRLGNAVGPHLHFEVLISGTSVDPMLFLAGGTGGAGWGGFINGMIPLSELCGISGNHRLRCDAARAYEALSRAYRKEFGQALCITDSYRSFAAQVTAFANKPNLAAVPGTSNHGWGLAVDLCGGIENSGSRQYTWMLANAPKFGWQKPKWSGENGGKPEPWHWEFGRIS